MTSSPRASGSRCRSAAVSSGRPSSRCTLASEATATACSARSSAGSSSKVRCIRWRESGSRPDRACASAGRSISRPRRGSCAAPWGSACNAVPSQEQSAFGSSSETARAALSNSPIASWSPWAAHCSTCGARSGADAPPAQLAAVVDRAADHRVPEGEVPAGHDRPDQVAPAQHADRPQHRRRWQAEQFGDQAHLGLVAQDRGGLRHAAGLRGRRGELLVEGRVAVRAGRPRDGTAVQRGRREALLRRQHPQVLGVAAALAVQPAAGDRGGRSGQQLVVVLLQQRFQVEVLDRHLHGPPAQGPQQRAGVLPVAVPEHEQRRRPGRVP